MIFSMNDSALTAISIEKQKRLLWPGSESALQLFRIVLT
jgi:hypothetical protein